MEPANLDLHCYLEKNIRIYHECEGGIEKSVPRITDSHHEACQVMPNGGPKGRIFLSHPHTNNGFIFLLTIKYHILCLKKRLPEVPEYAGMQHDMITSL